MRNSIQLFCLCGLIILAACAPVQAADQADLSKPVDVPPEPAGQLPASSEPARQPTQPLSSPPPSPAVESSSTPLSTPEFGVGVLVSVELGGGRGYEIRLIDPTTGQVVPGYTLELEELSAYAFTPDGLSLGVIESLGTSCEAFSGGSSCWPAARKLHLVNLTDWQDRAIEIPEDGWSDLLAFSPDGARLALLLHNPSEEALLLFDVPSGELLAQRTLEFRPSHLSFTLEGTAIALYGQPQGESPGMTPPGPPRALLVDATSLETQWDQTLDELTSGIWCEENCGSSHEQALFTNWQPAGTFSPDRQRLYLVHPDRDRLTTLDFVGRQVRTVEIQAGSAWINQLLALTAGVAHAKGGMQGAIKAAAISPDGTRLYVVGHSMDATKGKDGFWQINETPLGLQVVDPQSGRLLEKRELSAYTVRITPGGALLLTGWDERGQFSSEILDAQSLERQGFLRDWDAIAAQRMDGQPVFLATRWSGSGSRLAYLDPATLEVTNILPLTGISNWMVP
jgi:hypothetical protein